MYIFTDFSAFIVALTCTYICVFMVFYEARLTHPNWKARRWDSKTFIIIFHFYMCVTTTTTRVTLMSWLTSTCILASNNTGWLRWSSLSLCLGSCSQPSLGWSRHSLTLLSLPLFCWFCWFALSNSIGGMPEICESLESCLSALRYTWSGRDWSDLYTQVLVPLCWHSFPLSRQGSQHPDTRCSTSCSMPWHK